MQSWIVKHVLSVACLLPNVTFGFCCTDYISSYPHLYIHHGWVEYLTGLPMKTFAIAELRFLQATCLQVPKQWCRSIMMRQD